MGGTKISVIVSGSGASNESNSTECTYTSAYPALGAGFSKTLEHPARRKG